MRRERVVEMLERMLVALNRRNNWVPVRQILLWGIHASVHFYFYLTSRYEVIGNVEEEDFD